jgi:DNA-binding CsgD family transcriptional regulator
MLEISTHTVNQHLRSLYRKLSVHSRSMAVHVARQNGLLEDD